MNFKTVTDIKITSEILTYPNRQNQNIVAFYDYIDRAPKNNLIIIPPAYGETKKDSLKISYFLVKNGFNCLRFDATNHVGESDGDMLETSLEGMKDDLLSTLDFVEKEFKTSATGIVGTSLAIRVGIKAASQDKRIKLISGLVPIIDIQSSLKAIYHQDVIGEILNGSYQDKTIDDVMGFEVSINFALSAIKNNYHNLESTREDLKKIDIPIILISAQNDPWVNFKDVEDSLNYSPARNKKFILIPNAMHQINENPEAALLALQQTVINCKRYLINYNSTIDSIIIPSHEEMSRQWLIEQERFKNLLVKHLEGERIFWEKYLSKFLLIRKSNDYRDFLKQISGLLDVQQGECLLDAGCGNGHFGAWILKLSIEKIFREKLPLDKITALTYLGLDFVENKLKEGIRQHLHLLKKFRIINYRYILADLDRPLPIEDNHFDKICCNLVLSYLKKPQFTLNELFRVLKPGGKILVSSLKPYADLSLIYRDFADQTNKKNELEEARKLLSAAGRIKQKENAGIYNFFSGEELKKLFNETGVKNFSTYLGFGNQANIAVGEK